jgi:hypothetical protein
MLKRDKGNGLDAGEYHLAAEAASGAVADQAGDLG